MLEAAPRDDARLRAKFQDYRRLRPEDPEDHVWSAVSEAFDLEGDGARVLGAIERCLELNPDWGRHHLSAAKAFLRARQWQSALGHLERCSELDASGLDRTFFADNVFYYLGYALFGAARYKEAAESWRAADNDILYWNVVEPLKDFHLHRGFAHDLERDLLSAVEAYKRGLIAPGPGDCALDDDMDTTHVEEAQKAMNPLIQMHLDRASAGDFLDADDADELGVLPYTSPPAVDPAD